MKYAKQNEIMKNIITRLLLAGAVLSAVAVSNAACTTDLSDSQRQTGSIEVIGHVESAITSADVARIDIAVTGVDFPYSKTFSLTQTNGQWSGELDGLATGHYSFIGSAWDATTGGNQLYGAGAAVFIPVGQTAVLALSFHPTVPAAGFSNNAPLISAMTATKATVAPGETISIGVQATDPDAGDTVSYLWTPGAGTKSGEVDNPGLSTIGWTAPSALGPQTITVYVSDNKGATSLASITINVAGAQAPTGNVAVSTTFLAPAAIIAINVNNAQPKPGDGVSAIFQVRGGNVTCAQQDAFCTNLPPTSETFTTDCPLVDASQQTHTTGWQVDPTGSSIEKGYNLASTFGALTSCSITATFTDAAGLVGTGTVKLQLTQPTTTYTNP